MEFWNAKFQALSVYLCIKTIQALSVYLCQFQIYLSVFILVIWLVCMPIYLLSSDNLNLLSTDFDAFEVA